MELLIVIGAVVSAASALPYIKGVQNGTVRPKVVSWFTWCLLATLLTGAALTTGQVMSAVMSGVTVLTTGTVFVLGLRKGNRALDKLDIATLVGALAGMVVWLLLDNPTLAIFVALGVDIIAFIPTLVHGWTNPEEESAVSYGVATAGAGLGLIAASGAGATLAGVAYPVYAVVFNGAMAVLLTRSVWVSWLLLPIGQRSRGAESSY